MKVYVAAPYDAAGFVREHVHERLRSIGLDPTSRWAEHALGPENFDHFSPADLRLIAEANDRDVERSDVVLVIARAAAGGEMFAEARYALMLGKHLVWVGRRILSSWRHGVERVEDLDAAMVHLANWFAIRSGRVPVVR